MDDVAFFSIHLRLGMHGQIFLSFRRRVMRAYRYIGQSFSTCEKANM